MAKINPDLHLTEQEIEALLSTEGRCRIATIGPGDDINLTPMTFGWAHGRIYIFGRGQKVANLRKTPAATVLVDVGDSWFELQGIMLRGQARILESEAEEEAETGLAAARQNIATKHQLDKPYTATASGRSRRWIVFTPSKIATWNNARLKPA